MQALPLCREVMNRNLLCISEYETLTTAVRLLEENGFHHIPVLNKESKLVGMLSKSDIERLKMSASIFKNDTQEEYNEALFESLVVKAVMSRQVTHLNPSDSIVKAYDIFKMNQIHAIPIVEHGELVGLVAPLDLLDFFFNNN